jgi:hypothetical protein
MKEHIGCNFEKKIQMDQQTMMDKLELQELANKLFMYTDSGQWSRLEDEVFSENVWFDMTSAGGEKPSLLPARDICALWKNGFIGLDAVHHQAGHYLIDVRENEAAIFAYAIASHYKKAAQKGTTRSFVGSYDLKAIRSAHGWRLDQFKYNLKYMEGNPTLE